jgi:hypothetical protein
MRLVRTRLIVAAAVSAALAVAGCGSGEPHYPRAAANTLTDAAAVTTNLGGHHVEFDVRIEVVAGILRRRHTVHLGASGDIDRGKHRAVIQIDLSDLAGKSDEFGDNPDRLHGVAIERGPVVWVKLDYLTDILRRAGIDATWLEYDTSAPVTARTAAMRAAVGDSQQDAGHLLDYLEATHGKIERIGHAYVDGSSTVHYRGTAHLDRIGAGQPPAYRRALEANARKVMRLTGRDSIPVDAWLDDDGAVKQVALHYDLERDPSSGARTEGSALVVGKLSLFGETVVAARPPRDEVISLQELVRLAE